MVHALLTQNSNTSVHAFLREVITETNESTQLLYFGLDMKHMVDNYSTL